MSRRMLGSALWLALSLGVAACSQTGAPASGATAAADAAAPLPDISKLVPSVQRQITEQHAQLTQVWRKQLDEYGHTVTRLVFGARNDVARGRGVTTPIDGRLSYALSKAVERTGETMSMMVGGFSSILAGDSPSDALGGRSRAVSQIDAHYICNIHPRSAYFKAMAQNGLVPINVVDLTAQTIPYWELRSKCAVATGVEDPFLTAYREGSFHYLLIAADRI